MEWKEQVKNRFSVKSDANKWSNIYTTSTPNVEAVAFRSRRDFTVNYIVDNITENSSVLDIGCGAGPVLKELSRHNYNLTGIDYSFDMLKHAKNNLKEHSDNIPLIRSDCESIPYPDDFFECIICLGVISYVESIDKTLDEFNRILKPGGTLILSYRNELNSILLDPFNLIKFIIKYPFRKMLSTNKKIGQSLPRKLVLDKIEKTQFNLQEEKQIGFGNLTFKDQILSDGKLAIKYNAFLHGLLSTLNLNKVYRVLSDVHIMVLIKPL